MRLDSIREKGAFVAFSLAAAFGAATDSALAAEHELGLGASSYSAGDDQTEELFDVDSGPIPHVFYRYEDESNVYHVSLGWENWERSVVEPGTDVETELDFWPIVGSYRYLFTPDKSFSFFVGGGLGVLVYDARVEGVDGAVALSALETGAVLSLEPLAGIELEAGRSVTFHAEAKYSWQPFTASDLDLETVVIDVDLSGLYVTASVSFRVGGD